MEKYECENLESINNVERTCKLYCERRNEEKNARIQIYEVEEFKEYLLIYKQNGMILKTVVCQNPLTLILNHYKF